MNLIAVNVGGQRLVAAYAGFDMKPWTLNGVNSPRLHSRPLREGERISVEFAGYS